MFKKSTSLLALLLCIALAACSSESPTQSSSSSSVQDSIESSSSQESTFPSDQEILDEITPLLSNAVEQDLSIPDALEMNVGIDSETISDPVLYLGMPNQNTTFFFMGTLSAEADEDAVKTQLESILEGWVKTCEQGYISGATDHTVIQKGNKVFAVMHQDAESYRQIVSYLDGLEDPA